MKFALIDATGQIREFRDFEITPPDLFASEGVKWLPVEITDPGFDPAIELKTGPVTTILIDKVTRVWTVRALTAEELDARKENQIDDISFLLFELAFDHENRIRVLEAKTPITKLQFRNALKARLP